MPKRTLLSLDDLKEAKLLSPDDAQKLNTVAQRYSIAVTPEVVALLSDAAAHDPIARQFLPDEQELQIKPQELADPIGDNAHSPIAGLVHRYDDRVLVKLLTVCPVYCRFCFRRETVGRGKGDLLTLAEIDAALDYIAQQSQISEVILTGGDPMILSPHRIAHLTKKLAQISHVEVLRVHTRTPTTAPERVTHEWLEALTASNKAIFLALHINHVSELTANARQAIARIRKADIALLSQTVLLRGVNDDVETLIRLMRALKALQVKPYYLHHPDLAPGTSHFRLSLTQGQKIYAEMSQRLTGLALPAYVLDLPGGHGKIRISKETVEEERVGLWRIKDRYGRTHAYQDDV